MADHVKGLADDLDIDRVLLRGKSITAQVRASVVSATVRRTIDGGSTFTMGLRDPDREVIRSGIFGQRVAVNVDGLVFELVQLRGGDDRSLDLTFESGGVVDLKRQRGVLIAKRGTTTRTEFAHRLVRDVSYLKFKGDKGDPNRVAIGRGNAGSKRENSWDAIVRLASDRRWYAFESEETIWFGPGKWLRSLAPPFVIEEGEGGIDSIAFDLDRGKRAQTATVRCRARTWAAHPGAPVEVTNMGELMRADWLVSAIERSLFSRDCTVELIRPVRELPEPKPEKNNHDDRNTGGGDHGSSRSGTSSQGFQWPVHGTVTSPFGDGRGHDGIDIDGETGDPIAAAKDGHIIGVLYDAGGYGNYIDVSHDGGFTTRYGHLSATLVREGQRVDRGDHIGKMGNTGHSTGSHLHFEIRTGGTPVDPLRYLP